MKIPRQFHQFENELAMIIVSGNVSAEIYLAQDGIIEKIYAKEEETPHYSDREEFFVNRIGRSKYMGTGSVYESKEDEVEHRLYKDLKKEIPVVFKREPVTGIYILSAEYYMPMVIKAIPKIHKGKIKWTRGADLVGKHPTMILEALERTKQEKIGLKIPLSEEARKILKRGKK